MRNNTTRGLLPHYESNKEGTRRSIGVNPLQQRAFGILRLPPRHTDADLADAVTESAARFSEVFMRAGYTPTQAARSIGALDTNAEITPAMADVLIKRTLLRNHISFDVFTCGGAWHDF